MIDKAGTVQLCSEHGELTTWVSSKTSQIKAKAIPYLILKKEKKKQPKLCSNSQNSSSCNLENTQQI